MDKLVGKLDGAMGYLSGSIEYSQDHGVGWRRRFITLVNQAKLQIDLVDPTDKPGGMEVKIGENQAYQHKLQRIGRFRELQEYVHRYRHFDLRFTDYSDFLVVMVNPGIPQWGTADEVYFAEAQHKPMFFICEGGLSVLPRWLFDVIDDIDANGKTNVYTCVEDVVDELIMLDMGLSPLSDKWVLIRKSLEERRARNQLVSS